MDVSIFIAKLMGIYMLIVAAIWIFRKDQVEATIKEVLSSNGLLALSGVISLVLGLAIAIGHPIWEWNWRGLITVIGYLSILKGIMRLAFPAQIQQRVLNVVSQGYWFVIALVIVLGAYLTYSGFTHG